MARFFCLVLALLSPSLLVAQTDSNSQSTSDSVKTYTVPSVTVTTTIADRKTSPVAFSELSQADIARNYTFQDLPVLLSDLPSTLVYSENGNGIGYSNISIRGFDQRRIAVMINGIPQNDPEDHNVYWIDFPDLASSLESVQVQRGAGLASYGPAAIGGSINLQTSNFTDERSITLASGIGIQEYGGAGDSKYQKTIERFSLELSSGLVDNYAFYGRLSRTNSDGYRDQSFATLNSYFLSAVRYDDKVTTQINIFGGPLSDGLAYTGIPKSFVKDRQLRRVNFSGWWLDEEGNVQGTVRRRQEVENFTQPHYEMLTDWFVSDNVTLKSALFYYSGDGFFDFDASWADTSALGLTAANGYPDAPAPTNAIIRADVSNAHGGWLPRIEWRRDNGTFTAGAELRVNRSNHWGKIRYADKLPASFDPEFKFYEYGGDRDIFSVFARERHALNENVTLDLESQLVYHSYRIGEERSGREFTTYRNLAGETVGGGDDLFNVQYLFFNPRLGLLARFTEDLSAFVSAAYTSREPRMRNLYAASDRSYGATPLFESRVADNGERRYDFDAPLVDPERLLNFELGGNYSRAGYRLGLNLYWMEFFDELVRSGQLDIFGAPVDGNAERTRHIGLELEGAAVIASSPSWGALQMAGNLSYSSNRIVEFDFFVNDSTTVSLDDNPIAGFPDLLANLRLVYTLDDLYASVLLKYVGEFYTDNFKNSAHRNDAYSLVNFDIAYKLADVMGLQHLRLRGQINNVLNELYAAGGIGEQFFPAAERNFYFGIEMGL